MTKRPNILFAIADDASHFGAYGYDFVKTPNIDLLAKKGMLFNNAFTTNPKCAPSRAAICTGLNTWQLKDACCHEIISFPEEFTTFMEILDDSGYKVGYTGKGWAPGDYSKRRYNPAGPKYNKFKAPVPKDTNLSNIDYTKNFEYFINHKTPDQPFCFWYGSFEPHRHYVQGEGLRNGKKLEDIKELPPYWPDDDLVKMDLLDYAFEIEHFDKHLGNMIAELKKHDLFDNTIIIVTSDNGCPFPRVKGQMYEHDFKLPMVCSWPAYDSGPRVIDDIINFIDIAPTICQACGVEDHKYKDMMAGKSFVDLIQSSEDGFIDETRNVTYMGRENHDCGREGDVGYPVRCMRNRQYLYVKNLKPDRWPAGNPETNFTNCDGSPTKDLIVDLNDKGESFYYDLAFGKRPAEELYDIINDSACMNNLADKEEFLDLKNQMNKQLTAYLIKTNDPRTLGDEDIFDSYCVGKYGNKVNSWLAYKENRFKKAPYMDWQAFGTWSSDGQ